MFYLNGGNDKRLKCDNPSKLNEANPFAERYVLSSCELIGYKFYVCTN